MKKLNVLVLVFFLIFGGLNFSLAVKADDDHDEKHDNKHHEKKYMDYKEYEYDEDDDDDDRYKYEYRISKDYDDHDEDDDDDDEYEYKRKYDDDEYKEKYERENSKNNTNENNSNEPKETKITITKEYWHKWSRSVKEPAQFGNLPITKRSDIALKIKNEAEIKINVIPEKGQLLVPIEDAAKFLGAEVIIYPDSEIIELNKDDKQLIVRNSSKVVFENMIKTPMQVGVLTYDGKFYMPVSVLANGLGYQIKENSSAGKIELERVVQL